MTVIRMDIARLIADGQPVTHFGDNLFVDLDLTTESLPPGSQLRVGEARVEVTPEPHNGCLKFKGRFGQDALRFVQAPATRPENRRGIHWRVVEPGDVSVGAAIEVISRP
jgi:MOSC domain-containing protein YiiM